MTIHNTTGIDKTDTFLLDYRTNMLKSRYNTTHECEIVVTRQLLLDLCDVICVMTSHPRSLLVLRLEFYNFMLVMVCMYMCMHICVEGEWVLSTWQLF